LRLFRFAVALTLLTTVFSVCANAQTGARIDAYFGLGSARVGSSNQLIDTGTGVSTITPSMGGVFGTVGGGVMLTPSLGVGAQVAFRLAQGDYAGLGYRPVFYDFNGIFTPSLGSRRIMPEFQAGIGGASLRFYGPTATSCDYYTGRCTNFIGSNNHFQLHAAAGLRLYVKDNIFIRPQLDYHWVNNLTNEFKSNSVPTFSVAIGFSAGR
jgi:hypothetical protein